MDEILLVSQVFAFKFFLIKFICFIKELKKFFSKSFLVLFKIISEFDNSHDGLYQVWKTEFLNNFGRALAMVINIIDPDAIVLGGGVSNISFLYDEGSNMVQNNVFSEYSDTPILPNQLGDSAGVFGAALL